MRTDLSAAQRDRGPREAKPPIRSYACCLMGQPGSATWTEPHFRSHLHSCLWTSNTARPSLLLTVPNPLWLTTKRPPNESQERLGRPTKFTKSRTSKTSSSSASDFYLILTSSTAIYGSSSLGKQTRARVQQDLTRDTGSSLLYSLLH